MVAWLVKFSAYPAGLQDYPGGHELCGIKIISARRADSRENSSHEFYPVAPAAIVGGLTGNRYEKEAKAWGRIGIATKKRAA